MYMWEKTCYKAVVRGQERNRCWIINCTGVQESGVALCLSVRNASDMPRVQSLLKDK